MHCDVQRSAKDVEKCGVSEPPGGACTCEERYLPAEPPDVRLLDPILFCAHDVMKSSTLMELTAYYGSKI